MLGQCLPTLSLIYLCLLNSIASNVCAHTKVSVCFQTEIKCTSKLLIDCLLLDWEFEHILLVSLVFFNLYLCIMREIYSYLCPDRRLTHMRERCVSPFIPFISMRGRVVHLKTILGLYCLRIFYQFCFIL